VVVTVSEITDRNREEVPALRVTPGHVVRRIAELVQAESGPAGFYERPGFVPTGALDSDGEVVMRLVLPWTPSGTRPPT
jgi:hypothetical protein